jgi:hypothetical protein
MLGTDGRHCRGLLKKKWFRPFLQISFFPGLELTIEEIPVQYGFVQVMEPVLEVKITCHKL